MSKEKKHTVVFTQEEIDALWLISGKIGGCPTTTHRNVFSDGDSCIAMKFKKFVTPEIIKNYNENYLHYCVGSIEFKK